MSILTRLSSRRKPGPEPTPRAQGDFSLTRGEWAAILAGGVPVAIAGVILSFGGMYKGARGAFEPAELGALVPFAIDGMIVFGVLGWIAALRAGRRGAGFRMTAHLGVALTISLNAYSVHATPELIPWHVGGPIAWSLISEVVAHHIAARRRDELGQERDRIPGRLWVSAFGESWRTTLRMARTGERRASVARAEADAGQAAIKALRIVLPKRVGDRSIRRELRSRILAGSLSATEAFGMVDRMAPPEMDGSDGGLSIRDRALVESLRTAATRDGSDRMDGSDGRSDGRMDGSPIRSERVGMDGSDGWPSGLRPIGSDGGVAHGMDRANGRHVSALSGSANGSRVAGAVRPGPRRRSSGDPDAARPGDVDTAHALRDAGHLGDTPTADEIVNAFRAHANGLGLKYAQHLREYLDREHRQTA